MATPVDAPTSGPGAGSAAPADPAILAGLPAAASVLLPSGTCLAWPALAGEDARVRALPTGAPVALADRRPGGRGRLRVAADRLGVRVEAEYVVLPSWERATFVVDDAPGTVAWLLGTFLTTPPGLARGHAVAEGVTRLAQRVTASRAGASAVRWAVGAAAPGRLVVGTRT